MRMSAIYLAAGRGARMGGFKPGMELAPGRSLGSPALCELMACRLFGSIAVVVRPDDSLAWLPGGVDTSRLRVAVCREAEGGVSHSLRCGLSVVLPDDPDAVMIAQADQPFLSGGLIRGLVAALRSDREADYAACGQGSEAKPPALLSRSMFPALERLEGDDGAKRLLESPDFSGELIELAEEEALTDVDTPDDLECARRWWRLRTANATFR